MKKNMIKLVTLIVLVVVAYIGFSNENKTNDQYYAEDNVASTDEEYVEWIFDHIERVGLILDKGAEIEDLYFQTNEKSIVYTEYKTFLEEYKELIEEAQEQPMPEESGLQEVHETYMMAVDEMETMVDLEMTAVEDGIHYDNSELENAYYDMQMYMEETVELLKPYR